MARVLATLRAVAMLKPAPPGITPRGQGVDADSGKPLCPRRAEVEFLLKRVEDERPRRREILAPEALAEYKEAVDFYRSKLEGSR